MSKPSFAPAAASCNNARAALTNGHVGQHRNLKLSYWATKLVLFRHILLLLHKPANPNATVPHPLVAHLSFINYQILSGGTTTMLWSISISSNVTSVSLPLTPLRVYVFRFLGLGSYQNTINRLFPVQSIFTTLAKTDGF